MSDDFGFSLTEGFNIDGVRIHPDLNPSGKPFKVAAALRAGFVIAQDVARMPMILKSESETDLGTVRNRIKSPLATLLVRRPNDHMTPVEFVETVTLHAVFNGVGRAYIERNAMGEPKALHPVCGGGMITGRDSDNVVKYHGWVDGYGQVDGATRRDFIEIGNPRWSDLCHIDVSKELSSLLGLAAQLQKRQVSDADTPKVSGILSFPDALGQTAAASLKGSLEGKLAGSVLLDAGGTYKQLQASASEMQLLETRRFVIEDIARQYGLHPLMLGHDGAGQSLTRVQDVQSFHLSNGLSPWLTRWEQAIAFSLLEDDQIVDFDETRLFKMSASDRADYLSRALGGGGNKPWITQNEAREVDNRNPIEGGNLLNPAAEPSPLDRLEQEATATNEADND